MTYQTLITVQELAAERQSAMPLVILDCCSELSDPDAGRRAYESAHIPGAHHVSMQEGLSGLRTGRNGRNPLPEPHVFLQAMSSLGIGGDTQVVAYDHSGGLYAARLWWMLRWIGHEAVAVLDGGLAAWLDAGLPVTMDAPPPPQGASLHVHPSLTQCVSYDDLRSQLAKPRWLVLDARAADRFRGENEVLEAVGGHIPGARNRPFRNNLDAAGFFKPAAQLREEFTAITGKLPASAIVNQCGSGVSACHNLLAMEVASLTGAALYPGSWSEWSVQADAVIATGGA